MKSRIDARMYVIVQLIRISAVPLICGEGCHVTNVVEFVLSLMLAVVLFIGREAVSGIDSACSDSKQEAMINDNNNIAVRKLVVYLILTGS